MVSGGGVVRGEAGPAEVPEAVAPEEGLARAGELVRVEEVSAALDRGAGLEVE